MRRSRKQKKDKSSRTLVSHINKKSPISEQYRSVRTNIQFSAVDEDLQTIVVTSAGPGEGKSITSANVGVVFAQQEKKVLLVDTDLRKPTVHYTFRVENISGLTNYLIGDQSFEHIITETKVPNMDVITCGPIPPNPSEILSSKRMEQFIQTAKEHYDLIIFDTPPVLAVTDSTIVSNLCDGVLLVIRSKKTEFEAAQKAKDQLEHVNAKMLGVVLNDREQKESNYYYYYGNR
ncbi:CpsD/CapB family tyrosine-protein kinase [Salirhabdus salicampi]|uniref:CpsD/CapB family tyrosine-protein kinase n=1 Tax=Salirhabdus salicampi TaxID=476102 RepID=UPI0020C47C8E|nr:CpsD/CapB family tyrosine-protein kinase [Salirhabdus salicampi]MCP8617512.1 CpsD/CapB family tyrosine-protein kinase [Salirhabdus salicampi]